MVMATNLSVHAASPVEESGQLPFLGSSLGAFVQGRELAKLTGGWSATATAIDVWTVYLLSGDKLFASQSMDGAAKLQKNWNLTLISKTRLGQLRQRAVRNEFSTSSPANKKTSNITSMPARRPALRALGCSS